MRSRKIPVNKVSISYVMVIASSMTLMCVVCYVDYMGRKSANGQAPTSVNFKRLRNAQSAGLRVHKMHIGVSSQSHPLSLRLSPSPV